ncbi:hypothetical protein DFP72DRAFT_826788, partial [Ephemerocybe angulata]
YDAAPILGMVKMVPGIPMVYHVRQSGEPSETPKTYTNCCVQTLASLQHYSDYDKIEASAMAILKLTYRSPKEGIPRISSFDFKHNDRTQAAGQTTSKDGSFSIATTVMKGEGQGFGLPAQQVNSTEAKQHLPTLLWELNTLASLVMPKCMSKFEWEMIKWHIQFNNVVQTGSHPAGPTSVQLNISSFRVALEEALAKQGKWHSDPQDAITCPTFLALVINISKKGDPGAFAVSQGGQYLRENEPLVMAEFRGNNVHTGDAPHESWEDFINRIVEMYGDRWDEAGEANRHIYVGYQADQIASRTGGQNFGPHDPLGNYHAEQTHRLRALNITQDGVTALGGLIPHAQHVATELVMQLWNGLQACNIDVDWDVQDLMEKMSITVDDKCMTLRPLAFHPVHDKQHCKQMQGHWTWYLDLCRSMNIHIPRHQFKEWQRTIGSQPHDPSRDALKLAFCMVNDTCDQPPVEEFDIDTMEILEICNRVSSNDDVSKAAWVLFFC